MNLLVLTCAFICGFSIMTVELLGGKILSPYFGGSVHIWGSIITIFMLALSIGYLLGGRMSLKSPSLKRYGVLFLLSGVTLLPLIIGHEAICEWIFDHVEDERYGSLLASIILFFIPTVILGTIAPYSVRLLVSSADSSGQTAGFLYFVSTLGSALGTLATSFYLVLVFDINTILYGVMATLLASGVIAIIMNKPFSSHKEFS